MNWTWNFWSKDMKSCFEGGGRKAEGGNQLRITNYELRDLNLEISKFSRVGK